jgi:hypothetical protein
MSKEPKIRSVGKVCTAGVANTVYTCPANYVAKVMGEFKEGSLHSGKGGKVVKSPKQAIAIALSEANVKAKNK